MNDETISRPYDTISQYAEVISIRIVVAIVMSDVTRPVVVHDASRSFPIIPMWPDRAM